MKPLLFVLSIIRFQSVIENTNTPVSYTHLDVYKRQELMAVSRVFGYNEVIPNSLDLACKQFPLPNWMNGMSAYSLWLSLIHIFLLLFEKNLF